MPAAPSKPFLSLLLQDLTDPEEASAYIVAARADSLEMFRTAIKDVAQAHQMARVAKLAGITRESLYKAFSEQGNPTLDTLDSVLSAVGLEIHVAPKGTAVTMVHPPVPSSLAVRSAKAEKAHRKKYYLRESVGQLPLDFGSQGAGEPTTASKVADKWTETTITRSLIYYPAAPQIADSGSFISTMLNQESMGTYRLFIPPSSAGVENSVQQ